MLSDVAVKKIEIAPPETRKNRPTIMLPNRMQRIQAYWTDTSVALEQERLSSADRFHDGTYAYLLEDAVILDGNLFSAGQGLHLLPQRRHRFWADLKTERGEYALSSSLYGNMYWGHWLLDDCPRYFLAERFGQCVAPERPKYGHQDAYEKLLSMNVRQVNAVKFEQLWVFRDVGQNASKCERYRLLREKLLLALENPAPKPHKGVYLTRGSSGARRLLLNEQAVADRLASLGFKIIDPMQSSVETILRASAGAQVVAGVEGSALAHAIALMAPDTTLMVINPPNRFNNVYKDMTDCMNTNYAVVLGILEGEDFYVDLEEVDQTLALIENAQ